MQPSGNICILPAIFHRLIIALSYMRYEKNHWGNIHHAQANFKSKIVFIFQHLEVHRGGSYKVAIYFEK